MENQKPTSSRPQPIITEHAVIFTCSSPPEHVDLLSADDMVSQRTMPEGVILVECDSECAESYPCQHDVKLQSESDGSIYDSGLDGIEIALLIKAGKYRGLSPHDISHFADYNV